MQQEEIRPGQDERSTRKTSGSARTLALRLIELCGGTANVIECLHCTTRLRFRVKDSRLVDEPGLNAAEAVLEVLVRGGQLHIILDPSVVFKVHRHIVSTLQSGEPLIKTEKEQSLSPVPAALPSSLSAPARTSDAGRVLGDRGLLNRFMAAALVFSDIVVPIIPLFIGAGLMLGLFNLMGVMGWNDPDSVRFRALSLLTGSAFQIIAVMFGYHTARRFGGTPALGAVIGIVMTYPGFLRFTGFGGNGPDPQSFLIAPQFGYQGAVIPTILAVMLLALIEKGLRRIIPSSGAALIIPFLCFVLAGSLAVLVIDPLTSRLGAFLSSSLEQVFTCGGTVFGLLLGGIYSTIVITGLHQGIQAVEIGLISNPDIGVNFLLPIWSMANIAQAGAGLAVYARTRDMALRKVALPASITALFGITEPVTFGVNLKLGRPFLGAAAGGAAGGGYVAFHQVVANSFGLTGIPMIAFAVQPGGMNLVHYLTGFLIALATAFAVTWFLSGEKPAQDTTSVNLPQVQG
ncbi:PTS transporter subunit EIIC [Paenibacillus terreus]|uniref:PTS transporter subunit EIIC n=1 Tax=Paenibacillus terreus TaxID=1387834 RepID=A0ABV5B4W5_9BACL